MSALVDICGMQFEDTEPEPPGQYDNIEQVWGSAADASCVREFLISMGKGKSTKSRTTGPIKDWDTDDYDN